MIRLAFTLRKPPTHEHTSLDHASWATFKVNGVLQLDAERLVLEWAVTANKGVAKGVDFKMNVEEMPVEALELPVERLYEAKLHNKWWRPHLDLTANDLTLFHGVPGAEGSTLRLFVARADRTLADHIAADINDAIRLAHETSIPSPLPPG